jgi:uncharacterized protein YbjT (DUF2867 family)
LAKGEKNMYVILGVTGNTGKRIAEKLLLNGQEVKVVGRKLEKLQPLVAKGARPILADLLDSAALIEAFAGAEAAYVLIPPNYTAKDFRFYQNEVGKSIISAIEKSGIKYIVNLSSVGAHLANGVGVVNGLYDQEQRLTKLKGINVLILRPGFFMENNLMQIEIIRNLGIMGSPLKADLPVPQIATADIAEYAATRLIKLDYSGLSTQELLGPREISMNETASIIGKAIGKPDLKFVQFSYEDFLQAMIQRGMSESAAKGMVELNQAFNDGICRPTETRSPKNTTPSTLEEFAKTFAAAFRN